MQEAEEWGVGQVYGRLFFRARIRVLLGARQQALRFLALALAILPPAVLPVVFGCAQLPDDPESRYRQTVRARALLESHEPEAAEKILAHLAEASRKPDDLVNLGVARLARGDLEGAVLSLREALQADPTHVRALFHLAELELAGGMAGGAGSQRAGATLGYNCTRQQLESAASLLQVAVSADVLNAALQHFLGEVKLALGDSAAATAARREALRLDPGRGGTEPRVFGLGGIVLPQLRRPLSTSRTPPRFLESRLGARASGLGCVDVDASGREDLVLTGTGTVLRCDSLATENAVGWSEIHLFDQPITLARALLADGDALPDLVVVTQVAPDGRPGAYLVRGGSAAVEPLPALSCDVRDVEPVDLDRDGDLDLVLAASTPPGLRFWRNEGEGRFAAEAALPADRGLSAARSLEAADLDADGYADLVCTDEQYRVHLFGASARGFIDTSALAGLEGQRARAVAIADFDADGQLDLLLGDDEGLWLWANLGAARFARHAAYREARPGWAGGPRGVPVAALAALDLDNDGLQDLVTLHFREAPPVFVTTTDPPPQGEDTAPGLRRFAPLFEAPAVTHAAVWRNEGTGVFSEITEKAGIDRLEMIPQAPVAADFDRDGDLDLACVGADSLVRLLWNVGGNTNRRLEIVLVHPGSPAACHGAVMELYSGSSVRCVPMQGPVGWIGLGAVQVADVVRVRWPDGSVDNLLGVDLRGPGRLRLARGAPGS